MEYSLKPGDNSCIISISGEMTILQVNELKDVLSHCLNKYESTRIDFEQVKTIDLANVQLLCSANMTYEKAGRTLSKTGMNAAVIESALTEIGYNRDRGCLENPCDLCLWKGDE